MTNVNSLGHRLAVQDFRRARRSADLERIVAKLTGRPADLLSYDQVRRQLKADGSVARGLQEIPLAAIVGSVGRYAEFSRNFLPRRDSDQERWAQVKARVIDMKGWSPIEVYQIGDVYFVLDGNHRVSVARQLGVPTIQAYVTESPTKVPLTPDVRPDELIIKAEYTDFLERTRLDELCPEADLTVTAPGRYSLLEEQIDVQRYFMEQERGATSPRMQGDEVPYPEAVSHWYNEVYRPVAEIIRERGVLRHFPGRTETDFYVWLAKHRNKLESSLDWKIDPTEAALHLASEFDGRPGRRIIRAGKKLLHAVTPGGLKAGPRPGEWRETWSLDLNGEQALFYDLLVPIRGDEDSWRALEQALVIAQSEGGQLRGLHVVPDKLQRESKEAKAIQAGFDRRCAAAGIPGHLAVRVGKVARQICESARWADLVVLQLAHPPAPQPVARLESGFRALIRRCPRPILAVPGKVSPLNKVLLAYDGSPKADEALFIATYLGRWGASLVVVTVTEKGRAAPATLARAQQYLEAHGVQAQMVKARGPVAKAILSAAQERAADLLIMGGYGFSPLVEVVLGSAVDQVLRESKRPVLICR